jgi:hypothetical protein
MTTMNLSEHSSLTSEAVNQISDALPRGSPQNRPVGVTSKPAS